jgi:hypothetical protein
MGQYQHNLYYAILQLGTTPACQYADLASQPLDTVVVVEFGTDPITGLADAYLTDTGVGINTSVGTTALYRATTSEGDSVVRFLSTATDGAGQAEALSAQMDTLAAAYLHAQDPTIY